MIKCNFGISLFAIEILSAILILLQTLQSSSSTTLALISSSLTRVIPVMIIITTTTIRLPRQSSVWGMRVGHGRLALTAAASPWVICPTENFSTCHWCVQDDHIIRIIINGDTDPLEAQAENHELDVPIKIIIKIVLLISSKFAVPWFSCLEHKLHVAHS